MSANMLLTDTWPTDPDELVKGTMVFKGTLANNEGAEGAVIPIGNGPFGADEGIGICAGVGIGSGVGAKELTDGEPWMDTLTKCSASSMSPSNLLNSWLSLFLATSRENASNSSAAALMVCAACVMRSCNNAFCWFKVSICCCKG